MAEPSPLPYPPPRTSWIERMALIPRDKRDAFFEKAGAEHILNLQQDWFYRLRREQMEPPGIWDTWYLNAGRGFGKTLSGAYFVNDRVRCGRNERIALVGPTAADTRDVMVEGPSGILATVPRGLTANYEPSLRKVTWSNGAEAHLYSAEEPERLRGPQHDLGWCDEIAAWKRLIDTWDMYQMGLRLGDHPQTVITTTPKPLRLLKGIKQDPKTIVIKGTTFENKSLPKAFFDRLQDRYEGTRLGRQELYAEELEEAEGALWNRNLLEACRVDRAPDDMRRIVIAVDPSVTKTATSDEAGVMVAGIAANGHGYLFEDLSRQMTPNETCVTSVNAYRLWEADRIVAEANNGGDWIESGLRNVDAAVSYKKLHASRGKQARAEPVAALSEQKRIHHVGYFPELEDELCSWEPNAGMQSPNRLDALVWAFTELMLHKGERRVLHVRA